MTIEKVINYILYTPYNTNKAILRSMLETLITSHGGSLDEPGDSPDHIIYDGGMEQ